MNAKKNLIVSWAIVLTTLLALVGVEWLFISLAITGVIEFSTGLIGGLTAWVPIMGIGGTLAYTWEKGHDIGSNEVSDTADEEPSGDEQEAIGTASDSGTRTDADYGDSEHQS